MLYLYDRFFLTKLLCHVTSSENPSPSLRRLEGRLVLLRSGTNLLSEALIRKRRQYRRRVLMKNLPLLPVLRERVLVPIPCSVSLSLSIPLFQRHLLVRTLTMTKGEPKISVTNNRSLPLLLPDAACLLALLSPINISPCRWQRANLENKGFLMHKRR